MKIAGCRPFAEVLSSISKALGVCEGKIDILDLARAPLHLKAKVLSEGIIIIDRGYDNTLRLEVNTRYPEIAYQTRVLLRKWLDNPVRFRSKSYQGEKRLPHAAQRQYQIFLRET